MAELGRLALEGLSGDALAAAATGIVTRTLGVTRCALFRSVRSHPELLLVSAEGSEIEREPHSLPMDPHSLAWATMIADEARCLSADDEILTFESGAVEAVGLGITVAGKHRRYGVMTICSATPRLFGRDDANFLKAVANSLALALEREDAEKAAHAAALRDPLTGLPNRVLFLDELEHTLTDGSAEGRQAAVFFLDLDNFKPINDRMGHAAGDELLRAVARRLRRTMRPGDLVARYGGDEFTILCKDIGQADQAERIAARVIENLGRPLPVVGETVHISASVGYVLSSPQDDAGTTELLVQWADTAMYDAKAGGTGQVRRYQRLSAERPIAPPGPTDPTASDSTLTVHFQPIMGLASEKVDAVEAQIHVQHPGAREAHDGANDNSPVLYRAAMLQVVRWRQQGFDVVAQVKVSSPALMHPDLVPQLRRGLRDTRCPPDRLRLEVREATLLQDALGVLSALQAVTELGVGVVIDDFGSLVASLNHLRRLNPAAIRLDRTLLEAALASDVELRVGRALVSMAQALGVATIASGVDGPAALRTARAMGCDQAQGLLCDQLVLESGTAPPGINRPAAPVAEHPAARTAAPPAGHG